MPPILFSFQWLIAHGYILMFFAMVIEGPVVTTAAGFASALGYFDPYVVFALSIFGDLVADAIYYLIGFVGRATVIERFGHRVGVSKARLEKIELLAKEHLIKTLIFLKFTPALPVVGLMAMGALRIRFRKFLTACFFIILPRSAMFVLFGYYFGHVYNFGKIYNLGAIIVVGAIIVFFTINWLIKRVSAHFADNGNGL